MHRPVSDIQRAAEDRVDTQLLEAPHRSDDIENGVHRAYLMQMHALDRRPMNLRFDSCQQGEHRVRALFDNGGSVTLVNDRANVLGMAAGRLRGGLKSHPPPPEFPPPARNHPPAHL